MSEDVDREIERMADEMRKAVDAEILDELFAMADQIDAHNEKAGHRYVVVTNPELIRFIKEQSHTGESQ